MLMRLYEQQHLLLLAALMQHRKDTEGRRRRRRRRQYIAVDQEKGRVCYELRTETTDADDAGSNDYKYSGDQSQDRLRLASTTGSRSYDRMIKCDRAEAMLVIRKRMRIWYCCVDCCW